MERAFGKVHTYAECEDCGWRTDSHKNGQGLKAQSKSRNWYCRIL